MHTEAATKRLHHRLGVEPDPESEGPALDDSSSLARWLPAAVQERGSGWFATVRADPGRAGLFALGAVAVVAVLITVFTVVRDQPPAVMAAELPPVQAASSPPGAQTAGAAAPHVVISVVGLVHQPGLVTLQPGARIADALAAAGGALDGADLMGLNIARRVADGEQIVVGLAPMPGQPVLGSGVSSPMGATDPPVATSSDAAAPAAVVDLNAATAEELETLPGVGPVTAAAIVAWRTAHGQLSSVDELTEIDGIGPARLAKLRPRVRV